ISLNIEQAKGRDLFKKLVKSANIVIESFKPGYLAGLGLDYANLAKIKPDIIMTSVTPFGQDGPYSQYDNCDLTADAMSGWMYTIGDPERAPVRVGAPQVYLHAGGQAAMATMVAYHFWETTGQGQFVDVAVHGAISSANFNTVSFWDLRQQILLRSGPYRQGISQNTKQRELFECKDGFIAFLLIGGALGAPTNKGLVKWMGELNEIPGVFKNIDWDTFDQATANPALITELDTALSGFFKAHTMEEIFHAGQKYRLMITPVNSPKQITECPQLEIRQFWQKVNRPDWGDFLVAICPPHVSTGSLGFRRHAPRLGEHNNDIYVNELKLSATEVAALRNTGTI
ncbi:MAG TPA: CoA transferase, partial [Dehalococcoidales bacterium]|nr:CoA transferase [Dehalococcoidales bacterium]